MRLGKMLSIGEIVEQATIEEPPAPTESSVEKAAPVPAATLEEPAEPAVAHAEG